MVTEMERRDARTASDNGSRVPWPSALAALFAVIVLLSCPGKSSGEAGLESDPDERTVTVSIPVEGMSCGSCVASVTRAVKALDGVRDVKVDLVPGRARVEYAEGEATPEAIAAAISELGYKTGTPVMERSP